MSVIEKSLRLLSDYQAAARAGDRKAMALAQKALDEWDSLRGRTPREKIARKRAQYYARRAKGRR